LENLVSCPQLKSLPLARKKEETKKIEEEEKETIRSKRSKKEKRENSFDLN